MTSTTDVIVATAAPAVAPSLNWGAIIAGGVVAGVSTLILMLLGSGLGFTLVSPWTSQSASATTLVASAAIWLLIVQWVSSCLGGYLAGRLRRRWSAVHSDEVVFRDSAHGLLSWSVATLVVVAILGSATTRVVSSGVQTVSTMVGGAAKAGVEATSRGPADEYLVDALFRPVDPSRIGTPGREGDAAAVGQAARILTASVAAGEISADDKTYLTALVAARTGLPQADAQKRVDDVWAMVQSAKAKAQQAAETARKAAATTALLCALALLIGAFIASVSAILGGKLRDEDEDRWMLQT